MTKSYIMATNRLLAGDVSMEIEAGIGRIQKIFCL